MSTGSFVLQAWVANGNKLDLKENARARWGPNGAILWRQGGARGKNWKLWTPGSFR